MKIRPAQATLNELNKGQVMTELAQQIHDAIAAVKLHGKPATVTLSIGIELMKVKDDTKLVDHPLLFYGEVTSKLPKSAPPATVFYEDSEGNPTRTLQREPELGLQLATSNTENSIG